LLDWQVMVAVAPFLMKGAVVTVWLSVVVILISAPLALLVAVGRQSTRSAIAVPLAFVSAVARGLPPLIFLFAVYFLLPQFGIKVSSFFAATAGLVIYIVFYFAEALRAGLLSVDSGQNQAIDALGLPPVAAFFRIILPQALPASMPACFGYMTEVVKSSALTAAIALPELMANAGQMVQSTNHPFEVLIVASAVYLVLDGLLLTAQAIYERRLHAQTVRR
jgi:His/Glu/Gln/Arg/opine family amino acid ABC transporter permease subunit